jgi:hypothetical protein
MEIKQPSLILLFCCLLLIACTVHNSNSGKQITMDHPTVGKMFNIDSLLYKEVVLRNDFADTCIVFKDEVGDTIPFNRNFEIVENTFADTMNVGVNYVKPGVKGRFFTVQIDTSSSQTIFREPEYRQYIEERDLPQLYTKWLCLHNLSFWHWGKTTRTGKMRIRVYYKPKKSTAQEGS